MNKVEQYFIQAKGNRWFHYFAVFCRVALALGFMISGMVKILGERFAAGLSVNNPMGHYLEALYHTEYYYTFIGISQVIIALLLLFPRTAFLGALNVFSRYPEYLYPGPCRAFRRHSDHNIYGAG